jgi:hypothetical protein
LCLAQEEVASDVKKNFSDGAAILESLPRTGAEC